MSCPKAGSRRALPPARRAADRHGLGVRVDAGVGADVGAPRAAQAPRPSPPPAAQPASAAPGPEKPGARDVSPSSRRARIGASNASGAVPWSARPVARRSRGATRPRASSPSDRRAPRATRPPRAPRVRGSRSVAGGSGAVTSRSGHRWTVLGAHADARPTRSPAHGGRAPRPRVWWPTRRRSPRPAWRRPCSGGACRRDRPA